MRRLPDLSASQVLARVVSIKYPHLALMARVDGPIELRVEVDETGAMVSAKAMSGHPLLTAAGVKGIEKWKFLPCTRGLPHCTFT